MDELGREIYCNVVVGAGSSASLIVLTAVINHVLHTAGGSRSEEEE